MSNPLAIESKVQRLGDSPSGVSLIGNLTDVASMQAVITTFLEKGTIAKLADGTEYYFDAAATTGGITPNTGLGRWYLLSPESDGINVKTLGAIGDGVTDDTAAIAAAFAASTEGGTVFFPAGSYAITTITIAKSLRLIGQGQFASIIKRLAANVATQNDLLFFNGDGIALNFVEVENLGFDHVWGGANDSVHSCLAIYETNAVTIRNCYFTRGQYHGVKLNGCFNVLVDGCLFYQNQYDGLGIGGPGGLPLNRRATKTTVTNNIFEDISGGVIVQVGCDYTKIHNNIFKKSNIQFGQDCNFVSIIGNTIDGINTYGYLSTGQCGIFVEGCSDIIVSDNDVKNINSGLGARYGIWVLGSQVTVGGVTTQLPVLRATVRNNKVTYTTNPAIQVTAGSFDGSLKGSSIFVDCNCITQNVVTGDGIVVNSFNYGTCSHNSIINCGGNGIDISGVTKLAVTSNTIINPGGANSNSYYGIIIEGGSNDITLIGNLIADNNTVKMMRFGVFDSDLNGGAASNVKSKGNIISGSVTALLYYPPAAVPVLGTWNIGDCIQGFADVPGNAENLICVTSGAPGTWKAGTQVGYRSRAGTPVANFVPFFVGEECFDSTNTKWYKSTGTTNADWVALN